MMNPYQKHFIDTRNANCWIEHICNRRTLDCVLMWFSRFIYSVIKQKSYVMHCIVQYNSVWNLIYIKRHTFSNCQWFYMKNEGFLWGGKIAREYQNLFSGLFNYFLGAWLQLLWNPIVNWIVTWLLRIEIFVDRENQHIEGGSCLPMVCLYFTERWNYHEGYNSIVLSK